jgi:hypothetical protein
LIIKHGIFGLLLDVHFDILLRRLVRKHVAGSLGGIALARVAIEKRKIREPLLVNHMDAAVEHDRTTTYLCNDAAAADVLTRS